MTKSMKPSGIEWIGDIPTNWTINKLGYMFHFGKGLGITKEDLQDEGIPVVNYGEIHSKYGFAVNPEKNVLRYVEEKYLKTDRNSLLQYGDFVYADTSEDIEGSGNFTYLNSKVKIFAGYHTVILRPIHDVNHRYIAYLFDSIPFRTQIRNKVWGIKVYSITKGILKQAKLVLPPPEEQQAIASFLDKQCEKIDAIIADMEKQVEILKQYKTSLITETVTKGLEKTAPMKDSGIKWIGKIPKHWDIKRLKYILKIPLQYGANETGEDFDPLLPRYIRITDISLDNVLKDEDKLSLPINIAKPYLLDDGDILFARSGATVGKSFIYREKYGESAFAGYLIRAVCDVSKYDPKYIYYITLSNGYEQWLQMVFTQATIQNIGANKYENLIITSAPLKEQQAMVKYLDEKCSKVDNIISEKQNSISTMKSYKKSLIYEYVTGKKRVKGGNQ